MQSAYNRNRTIMSLNLICFNIFIKKLPLTLTLANASNAKSFKRYESPNATYTTRMEEIKHLLLIFATHPDVF